MIFDAVLSQTSAIFSANGYLTMPIGPRSLFFAATSRDRIDAFMGLSSQALAKLVNHAVVRRVCNFVGATSSAEQWFVEENLRREMLAGLPCHLERRYLAAAA
jgi:hypothetical protein